MSALSIKVAWPPGAEFRDELDATLARVQIAIGKSNVTEHRAPRAKREPALEIPVYYLAEWIAENWWVLLWEPNKDEESDDSEYLRRHSIVAAEHGFPLPDLSIVPFGRAFHLTSRPRGATFANVKFMTSAVADAPRDEVETVLGEFVSKTVERLSACGVEGTALAEAWNHLISLTADEKEFCQLIGSLGVPPGDASDELYEAIERIYGVFGSRATRDFCLAATRETVEASVGRLEAVNQYLHDLRPADFARLLRTKPPQENFAAPSWRRGMQAAKIVRENLAIDAKDPRGADRLFEQIGIDPSQHAPVPNDHVELPLAGAIDRSNDEAKVALLQPEVLHRRFSGARAAYLAWVSEAQSRRLVTNAVTRDQQASRSFAAEILIPQSYLKSLAGSKMQLHYDQVREAARLRRVMPDVAFKQAYNAGIRVGAI
ncbi:MAG TPA: hypothetical protein VMA54_20820 [Steroidobacteraceae bacterium]|nr:hypothetical protein [Steroidobacteraceae bacterium]